MRSGWLLLGLGGCAWVTDDDVEFKVRGGVDTSATGDEADADTDADADADADTDTDTDTDVDDTGGCTTAYYPDADGDGWGDAEAEPSYDCEPPSGWLTDNTDCDDADPYVRPGYLEVCGDTVDQDCNGADVACAWSGAVPVNSAGAVFYSTDPTNSFGQVVANLGDLDGDGDDEVGFGGYFSASGAGRVWLFDGDASLRSGALSTGADVAVTGTAMGKLGRGVFAGGDFTGDGVGEFVLTTHDGTAGGSTDVSAYFVFNGLPSATSVGPGASTITLKGQRNALIVDTHDVATAPHPTGTGQQVALGMGAFNGAGTREGAVYLLAGTMTGGNQDLETMAGVRTITVPSSISERDNVQLGKAVEACDLDGDGVDELIVGAAAAITGSSERSSFGVAVWSPWPSSDTDMSSADWRLYAPSDTWVVGSDVACADLHHVGTPQLVMPGAREGSGYRLWVTGPSAFPSGASTTDISSVAAFADKGTSSEGLAYASSTIATVDDLRGPDHDAVAIGFLRLTSSAGSTRAGQVFVLDEAPSGSATVQDAAWATIDGDTENRYFGTSLAGADADGDGYGDLLIGAERIGTDGGAAWILFGGP